jgi:hypothetical protein
MPPYPDTDEPYHRVLELGSLLVVGVIVDSVGIEKKYAAETHQRNFCYIVRSSPAVS